MRLFPLLLALAATPSLAAGQAPEIERPAGTPQADGAAHTLRSIPEACARLEGMFTGDAAAPYRFAAVRTGGPCQPRARLVDTPDAGPDTAAGWILNDVIRVPRAACPSQVAVVQVWRKPGATAAPLLDAQGRARIYLGEAQDAARSDKLAAVTSYAAAMELTGTPCR